MFAHHGNRPAADPAGAAQAQRDLIAAASTMETDELLGVIHCLSTNLLDREREHPNVGVLMAAAALSVLGERLQHQTVTRCISHEACHAFLASLNRLGEAVTGHHHG